MAVQQRKAGETLRIELLRQKINSEAYLCEAIQRIAQVLSNELLGIEQGGVFYGRQQKGGR